MPYVYLKNEQGEILLPLTKAEAVQLTPQENLKEHIMRLKSAEIILCSSNGTRFKLVVSDTGVIGTERVL